MKSLIDYSKVLKKIRAFEDDFKKSLVSYMAYWIWDCTIEFEQRNLQSEPYIVLRKNWYFVKSNAEIGKWRQPIFAEIIH